LPYKDLYLVARAEVVKLVDTLVSGTSER
jgi:hypothetical protein